MSAANARGRRPRRAPGRTGARAAGAGGRDVRVDILRGLALVSMFAAYTLPEKGPHQAADLTFYLTAPLFAVLTGVGAQLGDTGSRGLYTGFVRAGLRALLLVLLGLWLERWGSGVDIALTAMALPVLLAPFAARMRTQPLVMVTAGLWVVAPLLRDQFTPKRDRAASKHDVIGVHMWDALFTGAHFRGVALMMFACLGIVLWRWSRDEAAGTRAAGAGLAALAAAALMWFAQENERISFPAFSGTHLELLFCALLAGGLALVWFVVASPRVGFGLLAVPGSMTLSVYVAQIAFFAWLVPAIAPSSSPRPVLAGWPVFFVLTAGGLILPSLWRSAVTATPWTRGPLEGGIAMLTGLFRTP